MQGCEPFEKEAAEQAREDAHGQEEAGLAGDPARPVRRQAAAGNDDVDMRMMGQRRAPGVEDGGEADARAQMLGVGGDGGQRLGGGPEQEVVDGGLVLERDRADRRRQGEDDVIVGNRQELRLALGEPLPRRRALALRAVAVAAGIVGDRVRARSPRSARHGRRAPRSGRSRSPTSPSTGRGSRDRRWPCATPPHGRERRRRPPGGGRAMRPWSGGRRSAREVDAQPLQRALDVADRVDGDAGVERRRLQLGVSEQHLDHANIDALLEQMGGEAVPQGMRRHALGNARESSWRR